MAEPESVEPNGFEKMGLAHELLQAVRDLGFTQPTVVQEKTIPLAMQGRMRTAAVRSSPT
jgi:superfamily II DNA/RNA helicase